MAKKARKAAPRKKSLGTAAKKKKAVALNALEHLTLVNVRVIELNAKIDVVDGKLPNKATIESQVTIGPSPGVGILLVDGFTKIESRPANDPESASVLIISVHLQCVFKVEGVEVDDIEPHSRLVAQSGMLIMWPHFREIIQSVSGRMGVQPIVLPMYISGKPGKGKGERVIRGGEE